MAKSILFVLFLAALIAPLCSGPCEARDYLLFYLGGQSNMDGYGTVKELPEELTATVGGTMIFHGNTAPDGAAVDGRGVWKPLRPGHGVRFASDGKTNTYSDRFGVELTFARRLREVFPDQPIALVKYSRGGTSIAAGAADYFGCWEPDFTGGEGEGKGVNQYDHFLATVHRAMSVDDIDGDGEKDRLIPAGIVWMQGESDARFTAEIASRYEANLKRLVDLIRAALRVDDLPVVIGRISDSGRNEEDGKVWDHGGIVRDGQAAFVKKDGAARLVTSTDNYGYSDPWHYDSAGYIDLGKEFADAMIEMIGPAEGE